MTTEISEWQAQNLIESSDGLIFSVEFVRRTNTEHARRGDHRKMVARIKVTKYLKFRGRAYEPSAHKLVDPFVFDMQMRGYKSIPLNGLISIKFKGEMYTVTHG